MKPVKVYSTDYCPFCVQAKQLLDREGVPYEEVNVQNDAETRAWLVEATGQRTVPQIFIGEESIGGFTELHALSRGGGLQAKLTAS